MSLYQVRVSKNELAAYTHESLQALRSHVLRDGETVEPIGVIVTAFRSASDLARAGEKHGTLGRAQLEIYWGNMPRGVGLWERIEVGDLTRADYEALLKDVDDVLTRLPDGWELAPDDLDWFVQPAQPQLSELTRYNPERLRKIRSYGEPLNRIGIRHKGQPTAELYNEVMQAFAHHDADDLGDLPLRRRSAENRNTARAFTTYTTALLSYATFCGSGRQIFDMPQPLLDMFSHTDVDDIQWANIKFPYSCIYLHFGAQPDLDLGKGWLVEGAYLQEVFDGEKRYVNITVVAAPPSLEAFLSTDTTTPPTYVSSLSAEHMGMALAEALDMVLSEKLARLKLESEKEPLREDIERAAREQGVPPGVRIVSVQRQRAQEELQALEARHTVYRAALRLVVNSLCYLTAYPGDISTSWPSATPKHLLKDLERAGDNRNERAKALNRLAQMGYSAVHLCGRQLAGELTKRQAGEEGPDRVISAHWVRGHWFRQPHGPAKSLRRLQWRMPFVRRSRHGDDGEPPLGHIYLANP